MVRSLFCCLFFLSLSVSTQADEQTVLKIAGYDYPPLYYLNESEQVAGELFNVLSQMCRKQRVTCHFFAESAARSYRQLEDGSIDMLLTGKIPRFDACCEAIDWAYTWTGGIYSREKLTQKIDSSLLDGHSLVIPLGLELPYLVFNQLKSLERSNKARVIEARTARLTLKMFAKGRGDFVWSSSETGGLLQEYSEDKEAPYFFYPLKVIPIVGWVNHTNPRYKRIMEGFNRAYAELIESKAIADDGLLKKPSSPALL